MKNAPWWLISAGIHLVLLFGAALVFLETMFPFDDSAHVVMLSCSARPEGGITIDEPPPLEQIHGPWLRSPDPVTLQPGIWKEIDLSRPAREGASASAVVAALRWLARHQNPDGSWSAAGFGRRCPTGLCGGPGEGDYDTGVTSLAVLAFLGAGYTPLSKGAFVDPVFPDQELRIGDTVKRGLQWLLSQQDPEGAVGPRVSKLLYNHALATFALSEAYGMTSSSPLREPTQKAVDFLVAAQNPGKGWRYSPRCGDSDTSVTGWAVIALKSAEMGDLHFPRSAYDDALAWIAEATNSDRVGYVGASTGKVSTPGRNENFADHPTMTAIGLLSRVFIQKHHRDIKPAAVKLLTSDPPVWKPGHVDFYYWYYGSWALFQVDQDAWQKWNESLKVELVEHQKGAGHGCESGSWDPSVDRWGSEGGRVYATALNAMSMEYYYIYPDAFGPRQRDHK